MGLVEASNTTAMVGSSTAMGFISTGFSRIGDHIADVGSLNADNGNDVARMSLGDLNLAKVLESVHLANLGVVRLARRSCTTSTRSFS